MLRTALALAAFALACGSAAPSRTTDVPEDSYREPVSNFVSPVCVEKPEDSTPARACPGGVKVEPISEYGDKPIFDELQRLLVRCAGECKDCDVGVKFDFVVLDDGSTCNVTVNVVDPPDHAACLRGEILRGHFRGPHHAFRVDGSIVLEMTHCDDSD